MKHTFTFLLCSIIAASGSAQDQTYSECVSKISSSWGKPCQKCESYDGYKRDFRNVYQVELKNVCNEAVELKVAMQESNGRWHTFPIKALGAGETMTAYACDGTGKYLYWVRRLNDTEIVLPSDQEILTEYRDRH